MSPKHEANTPPSINASLWNRIYTLTMYRVCRSPMVRMLRGDQPTFYNKFIINISDTKCIKATYNLQLAEAHTMVFVAKHTSMPVPKVYTAFRHRGQVYILMERLPGVALATGWQYLDEDGRRRVLSQLKSMVEDLRAIRPPPERPEAICDVNGGPVFDPRLFYHEATGYAWGPYESVADFHLALREGLRAEDLKPGHVPGLLELIETHERYTSRSTDQGSVRVALTHGDLSSFNILADGDTVTGIVDWETAGWWPAYWEYTSNWFVSPRNPFWKKQVDQFITPLPEELEMEKQRRRFFGQFGMS